jgi:DNA-binding NtrC family response regulator
MWLLYHIGVQDLSNIERIVSIVDDEINIAKLFHEALLENIDGISVFSFVYPVMAFQHFTENHEVYALVICDLRMPNLNGLELLKKVKTLNPKVRTMLMSAYNFEEEELYQKYMKEAVINSTIEKPVTMNRLYQRVRDELSVCHKGISEK